jgi:hypothetical protein
MPQVAFNTNTFSGAVVFRTEVSELYHQHLNICKMRSLTPEEKREALHMAAEDLIK